MCNEKKGLMLKTHLLMRNPITIAAVYQPVSVSTQNVRGLSKRGPSSKWAFSAYFFQKPLLILIKTRSLLASKKTHDLAKISP